MTFDNETVHRKIVAARPAFVEADLAEVLQTFERILRSGWLILGEHTREFEHRFAEYVGAPHAVAVSSCSAALQIALRFYDVRGREVLVPTNNFPGVVSAILYEGGTPMLADMNPATFCVDTDDLLARITPRTAGIIVVHIAGLVYPDIDRVRQVCNDKGIFLLEDAAHALGAAIDGRRAGNLADAGCFSFYPTKIITTGTGGMMTTHNAALADYARSVRHYGQGASRGTFVRQGSDWSMSELHAALGVLELRRLDARVAHRNRVAGWYRDALSGLDWLTIPTYPSRILHAYYKFPTLLAEAIDAIRFRQIAEHEFLIENGTIYDPPCHLQPVFRDLLALPPGGYPAAESTLKRQFCPPMHSTLSREDVQRTVEVMTSIVDRCRRA